MDNNKNTASPTTPQLCLTGCGFYGSEHFLGLCSKCHGAKNKKGTPSSLSKETSSDSKQHATANHPSRENYQQTDIQSPNDTTLRRKNPRPLSSILSDDPDYTKASSSTSSPTTTSCPSSNTAQCTTPNTTTDTSTSTASATIPKISTINCTSDSSESNTPTTSNKPVQLKKSRCFNCRVKVPLAKQTINKCRCDYVFCDSHRFPDRHDCEIDYAKIGRDLLAKNNPKLQSKGGRSFNRIDSL